jgi:hypothetical protein
MSAQFLVELLTSMRIVDRLLAGVSSTLYTYADLNFWTSKFSSLVETLLTEHHSLYDGVRNTGALALKR